MMYMVQLTGIDAVNQKVEEMGQEREGGQKMVLSLIFIKSCHVSLVAEFITLIPSSFLACLI